MPLVLDGTNGVSGVDGTASNPAIEGTDSNTGIFYPAADTVAIGTGGTERVRVVSAGDVGIGTSTPATISNRTVLSINNASNGGALNLLVNGTETLRLLTDNSSFGYVYNIANQPLLFGTNNTERMRLDASGNLGIGATSLTRKIQVDAIPASANQLNGLRLQMVGVSTSISEFLLGTDGVGVPFTSLRTGNDGNSYMTFATGSGPTERARITSDGQLLVGKTSTSDSVVGATIRGTGYFTSTWAETTNATTTYHVYSTGTGGYRFYVGLGGTVFAVSTTISAVSDQRLKENIQNLDVGLDAVMALKPRKFDWKEGQGKDIKGDRGFIAQEFETVFPDLIDEWRDPAPEGEEPYKSVRQDLIPVLVKAIQEQQAMIDELKAKVAALENA